MHIMNALEHAANELHSNCKVLNYSQNCLELIPRALYVVKYMINSVFITVVDEDSKLFCVRRGDKIISEKCGLGCLKYVIFEQ